MTENMKGGGYVLPPHRFRSSTPLLLLELLDPGIFLPCYSVALRTHTHLFSTRSRRTNVPKPNITPPNWMLTLCISAGIRNAACTVPSGFVLSPVSFPIYFCLRETHSVLLWYACFCCCWVFFCLLRSGKDNQGDAALVWYWSYLQFHRLPFFSRMLELKHSPNWSLLFSAPYLNAPLIDAASICHSNIFQFNSGWRSWVMGAWWDKYDLRKLFLFIIKSDLKAENEWHRGYGVMVQCLFIPADLLSRNCLSRWCNRCDC